MDLMHVWNMGLLEFTIPGKLIINLCSPAIKRNVLGYKAFVTCIQRARSTMVRDFTSDRWMRGEGDKVFFKIGEWQNQASCSWLNTHSMECYPQLLFFCEGLGKSGSLSLYPVPRGKLSPHALSEYHLSYLIIKEISHTLTMSVGVFHSVVLSHWPTRHVDSS